MQCLEEMGRNVWTENVFGELVAWFTPCRPFLCVQFQATAPHYTHPHICLLGEPSFRSQVWVINVSEKILWNWCGKVKKVTWSKSRDNLLGCLEFAPRGGGRSVDGGQLIPWSWTIWNQLLSLPLLNQLLLLWSWNQLILLFRSFKSIALHLNLLTLAPTSNPSPVSELCTCKKEILQIEAKMIGVWLWTWYDLLSKW